MRHVTDLSNTAPSIPAPNRPAPGGGKGALAYYSSSEISGFVGTRTMAAASRFIFFLIVFACIYCPTRCILLKHLSSRPHFIQLKYPRKVTFFLLQVSLKMNLHM